ncbi:MAG: GAF domain-containing sensor histidine kinase [Solirubrobacteraceae bacterium]
MGQPETARKADPRGLGHELATFRRLATLVAHGAPPAQLFVVFADEIGGPLPGDHMALGRYLSDGTVAAVGAWDRTGKRHSDDGSTLLRAANLAADAFTAACPTRRLADDPRHRWRIAVPVMIDGRPWGVMVARPATASPLPADADVRLLEFAGLLATVIANAESRAALASSRARLVAAADQARRQIERDLHDGAQQRLVSLALQLRVAHASVPSELHELRAQLERFQDELNDLLEDLRTIAHGIHPAILDAGGLAPALMTLARRSPLPVAVDVNVESRLAPEVEVAAYYTVSETLTNVAKHARATRIEIAARVREQTLLVEVSDNGIGGADAQKGTGLMGLIDRVEALGGSLSIRSPEGEGTSVLVALPAS